MEFAAVTLIQVTMTTTVKHRLQISKVAVELVIHGFMFMGLTAYNQIPVQSSLKYIILVLEYTT